MSHTTSQTTRSSHSAEGLAVGWLTFFFLAFTPRVIFLGIWIFSDLLGRSMSAVVSALGFIFLPSTTVCYALMWGMSSDRVSGAEWIVVGIGLLLDLIMWGIVARLRS